MVVQLSCSLTCNWQQPWYLVQVHCSDTFFLVFHCYIFLLLSVFLLLSSFVDCNISFLYRKQLKFKTIPTMNEMFEVRKTVIWITRIAILLLYLYLAFGSITCFEYFHISFIFESLRFTLVMLQTAALQIFIQI